MGGIASKEQERKVLNQITKLLDSLGEDSYCGCAFAGCVEMAKENVGNDFCNRWQSRYDAKAKQVGDIHDQLVQATVENEKLQASLKSAAYDLLVLKARLYDMEHPKDGQFGC